MLLHFPITSESFNCNICRKNALFKELMNNIMSVKRARRASFFLFSQQKLMPYFVPVITFFEAGSEMSTRKLMIASLV